MSPEVKNMNAPATTRDAYAMMHREHEALRDKLGQIHDLFSGNDPSADEIKRLLHEFEEALVVHFSHEEEDGFFNEIVNYSPALAPKADRLCVEHEELRQEAIELYRFATSGCPSMPWWRELAVRCHNFSQKLMHHESEENRLLQIAHRQELGVVD
jgi:hemerythrin